MGLSVLNICGLKSRGSKSVLVTSKTPMESSRSAQNSAIFGTRILRQDHGGTLLRGFTARL